MSPPVVGRLPVRLHTRRARMLWLLAGSAAFVAGGGYVVDRHPLAGYSAIVFFGLGIVVALANLLPQSSYLELEEGGFTICSLFRKSSHRWSDVAEFVPVDLGGHGMVGMKFLPHYRKGAAVRKLAKHLAGADGAFPDTYGCTTAELVTLLNGILATKRRSLVI